jgi:hypothetical protein
MIDEHKLISIEHPIYQIFILGIPWQFYCLSSIHTNKLYNQSVAPNIKIRKLTIHMMLFEETMNKNKVGLLNR